MWVRATVSSTRPLRGHERRRSTSSSSAGRGHGVLLHVDGRRSFLLLSALQLGSLVAVSLVPGRRGRCPLAVLAVVFGVTMLRATQEFRSTTLRSMRHSLEADAANAAAAPPRRRPNRPISPSRNSWPP